MFRTSLRSVADPLREHVCLSCLGRRFGGPPRLRQFYSTTSPRANHAGGQAEDASLQEKSPSEGTATSDKGSQEDRKNRIPNLNSRHGVNNSIAQHSSPTAGGGDGPERPEDADSAASPAKDGEDAAEKPEKQKKSGSREQKGAEEKKDKKVITKDKRRRGTKKSAEGKSTREETTKEKKPRDGSTKKDRRPAHLQGALKAHSDNAAIGSKETPKNRETAANMKSIQAAVRKKHSGSLSGDKLTVSPLDVETAPVPKLSFGLERILFNPGVYHLRDPRSRVFNFDPYLGSIMPVTEFDFDALKEYITSSRDETLRGIALQEKKKYVGSSSSMTSVLSHFHYLLSAWRAIDARTVSQGFPDKLRSFTRLLRAPSAMFLRYQDGVYAIDADKEFDSANILMNLGKSMEKLLTLPKEEFERYRRSSANKISAEEEQATPEAYHYSTLGDFIMRSQLDAYDPRLPGTGMFDLKTRAVVSIRMDAQNFEHGLGYEIKDRFGAFESYEREFFDMIRAAFLKYSLQVRIGRMDGIFVAFHNIERIFGFQYVSLPEMDQTLHGQQDTTLGDKEFHLSLGLWNKVLDKATAKFPERSLRFHFETRDAQTPFMYIFAEPVTEDEIHAIQTKNKEEIDAYQRRILNLAPHEGEAQENAAAEDLSPEDASAGNTITEDMSAETLSAKDISTEDVPTETISENTSTEGMSTMDISTEEMSIEDILTEGMSTEKPSYDSSAPPDESFLSQVAKEEESENDRELLAMTLIVRNKVNGRLVERPTNLSPTDNWTVDYELSELQNSQAQSFYNACQKRRQKSLQGRGEDETDVAASVYIRKLRELSKQGRMFREKEDDIDKERGIVVLNEVD